MPADVIVPFAEFVSFISRLEALEAKVEARLIDGIYRYGPCLRCGYGPWDSSSSREPRCCPRCHSAYWSTAPKRSFARTPDDPPHPTWDPARKVKHRRSRYQPPAAAASTTVVEAPTSAAPVRTPIILPPELRPPGEPLIPPPPRITPLPDVVAARTVDNPMNVRPVEIAPTEHVAVMPEAIVEALLNGESVTYEDIKAAKEGGDVITDSVDLPVSETVREKAPRPTDANLQAKKDAFFADAIAAGLVSSEPTGEAATDSTPFVSDNETPSLTPPPEDDPFWK